jgi:hypothetical protein
MHPQGHSLELFRNAALLQPRLLSVDGLFVTPLKQAAVINEEGTCAVCRCQPLPVRNIGERSRQRIGAQDDKRVAGLGTQCMWSSVTSKRLLSDATRTPISRAITI